MQTQHGTAQTFGDLVATSYDLSSAIASSSETAAVLATRHLERVLLHGSNLRLTSTLARLGRQLGPTKVHVRLASVAAR